jgi:hypothetical protein
MEVFFVDATQTAAVLAATVVLASIVSVEVGLSVALIELALGGFSPDIDRERLADVTEPMPREAAPAAEPVPAGEQL